MKETYTSSEIDRKIEVITQGLENAKDRFADELEEKQDKLPSFEEAEGKVLKVVRINDGVNPERLELD
jgi:hypothetical protein